MQTRMTSIRKRVYSLPRPDGTFWNGVTLVWMLGGMFAFAYLFCSGNEIPEFVTFVVGSCLAFFVFVTLAAWKFGLRGVRWYGAVFISLWTWLWYQPQMQLAYRASMITRGMSVAQARTRLSDFCGRQDSADALQYWATPDRYAVYGSTYVRIETNGAYVTDVSLRTQY